jgi:hypothetical protein
MKIASIPGAAVMHASRRPKEVLMRKAHVLLIGLLALASILVGAVPQAQACNRLCLKGFHCCGSTCVPNSQSCPK